MLHSRERNDHQGTSTQADDRPGFNRGIQILPTLSHRLPTEANSEGSPKQCKRNGHLFHLHVRKRAVRLPEDAMSGKEQWGLVKMAASPFWQAQVELSPIASSNLAQGLKIPPSPWASATERPTSLVALLEPHEVQWLSQKLEVSSPRSRRAS